MAVISDLIFMLAGGSSVAEMLADLENPEKVAMAAASVGRAASTSSLIVTLLITGPMTVSLSKFLLNNREGHGKMGDIFFCFNKNYLRIVLSMFMMNLFLGLWFMLLIVPGIIKTYSYRMVPYLVAENPEMDFKDAIDASRKMMDGEKWKTFVLDLSFLGWIILTSLTCGILGIFYTTPYISQTNAELYTVLKAKLAPQAAETTQM